MEASIKKGFAVTSVDAVGPSIMSEEMFHQILYMEKRRAERSKKPFFLMLLNTKGLADTISHVQFLMSLEPALAAATRETDIKGWYEEGFILGVLFTELGKHDLNVAKDRIFVKVHKELSKAIGEDKIHLLELSFCLHPETEEVAKQCAFDVLVSEMEDQSDDQKESSISKWFLGLPWRNPSFMVCWDVLWVSLALVLAVYLRLGSLSLIFSDYLGVYAFNVCAYPLVLFIFDQYNNRKAFSLAEVAGRVALSCLTVSVISTTFYYLFPELLQLGRGVMFIQLAVAWTALTGWRWLFHGLCHQHQGRLSTLVLGAGRCGRELYGMLHSPASPYEVTGFLDDDPAKQGKVMGSPTVIGTIDQLGELASSTGARTAILALPRQRPAWLIRKTLEARLQGIEILEAPAVYERVAERIPVEHIEDQWLLFSDGFELLHKQYIQKIKRAVDLAVSAVLLILTLPVTLIIAAAIYLESPGPVFYKQERVGKGCRVFRVLKFRSMSLDAEKGGAQWAQKKDPRVTRVGRWIRMFRIDELPQIWNVFKGEMTLVGPRPERPQFVKELESQIPYYNVRHTVPPGITGWAQVKYPYGSTVEDAQRKLEYDLYYIKNMSVLLDLKILLRTVGVVLLGEGAR
jgi:sugar transferase (PEP-CTERM system associated)